MKKQETADASISPLFLSWDILRDIQSAAQQQTGLEEWMEERKKQKERNFSDKKARPVTQTTTYIRISPLSLIRGVVSVTE